MPPSGILITFEGGEGAGKSWLLGRVHAALLARNWPVLITREPGGTPLGAEIRQLLLSRQQRIAARSELLLYLADRAQHVEERLIPALKAGTVVLCDRFCDSSRAYQGGGRGIETGLVEQLCAFASAGITPALTLYLDIDPQLGLQRARGSDRIEAERLSFHQRVRETFLAIAARDPQRVRVIAAHRSQEEVFAEAMASIEVALRDRASAFDPGDDIRLTASSGTAMTTED